MRLPNGNYACHHKCKDKTSCRHICCREGLVKPPSSPKYTNPKPTIGSTLSSPVDPQRKPKNTIEKQQSNLSHLHKKTNDGARRVKRNSLVRSVEAHPSAKKTTQYVDSLLSSPIKLSVYESGENSPDSDQELPEPSLIGVKKHTSPESGPTNYDDSDLDQWAANLPSEVLELEVETPTLQTTEDRSDSGLNRVVLPVIKNQNKKRLAMDKESEPVGHKLKRPKTEHPSTESLLEQDTHIHKSKVAGILPTPRSSSRPPEQPKPLFRPSSSVGTPSPQTSTLLGNRTKTPASEDAFENFMDYMFEGVKIITKGSRDDTNTMYESSERKAVNEAPLEPQHPSRGSPLKTEQKLATVVLAKDETPKADVHNPMADFNHWLDENGL
ncbi:hypothetical protein BN14_01576 [Rhizoctonia solani AG-1 IB]|uniref:Uncharacterized protein n=1 Tax=Thanatephorus cucumeris (strain AG1-IB / isolate 7/3/14) TaxID=1108050 RepID=M5BV27_THACB|nr:hypothetical protein BN14_01576 [Rhizoctonia solani AG-1 IB]